MFFLFPLLEYVIYAAISSTIFYSARRAKILKIAITTSTCSEFRSSSKAFVNRAQNQGCNTVVLKRKIS